MADPFSIVASTASIADICIRLVRYLKDVKKGAATIEDDITSLVQEVEALDAISTSIQQTFKEHPTSPTAYGQRDKSEDLWMHIKRTLQDCKALAKKLETIVQNIYGKSGPTVSGFRDAVAKSHRRRGKEGDLRQCRDQLATFQNVLQILLAFINLHSTKGSQEANAQSFEILTEDLRNVDQRLGSQIATLQDSIDSAFDQPPPYAGTITALRGLRNSIDYAAGMIKSVSSNKHFDIPQPVSSIFTGRDDDLERLKNLFISPPGNSGRHQQIRFVIHGIGGSGKTQFCSKFAEDNRESFWGVFWVDASTTERMKQTYAQISKVAEVEPNPNAAMHWLSNLEEQWLLIIDNADDPNIHLETYFPKGNRGHILVTTRNPAHKVHGNVGPGFFEFQGLNFQEANDLLLKAARVPTPWDSTSENSASAITKSLGFLVLAIVHAGAVIRDGLCTLKTFLSFYERSWTRLRRARIDSGHEVDESTHHMYVYTTWELCYQRIESKGKEGSESAQDAIQLLSTFSFMHWENIRYDIFRRAIDCPRIEAEHQKKEAEKEKVKLDIEPETFSQKMDRFKMAVLIFLLKNRSPLLLPNVIRDARQLGNIDEYDDRIRYALKELVQMSLVTYNEANDSYSMHPIVHKWARERPGMRLAEQAIWSEAAATILSSSLLLPPLRNSPSDEDYHRDVLPHVDHVRICRNSVNDRITRKIQSHWTSWFAPRPSMSPERGLMYAKFSLVYAHNGYWPHAEVLLSDVKNYLTKMLGPGHERTRRVTLALAGTYWNMGRGTAAEKLQRSVLHLCLTSLGPEHVDTLRAKDVLGETMWQGGRYSEAKDLHEEAYHGLSRQLGSHHVDALNALDNLARTIGRFWEREHLEQAHTLHSKAIKGMEKAHGRDHPRTLIAKENLVRVFIFLGGELHQAADALIAEVIEKRREKLGKEHPYTLLAMANAAIVKRSLGKLDEAEELMMAGLPIAERNLGEDHIGTLFGYHTLGSIRIEQRRYREAEEILVDVTERQKHMLSHRGAHHPDRLGAMIELAKCYRLQGKITESIRMCDETLAGFEAISTREHPLARDMKKARRRMMEHQHMIANGEIGDPGITEPSCGSYGQFSLF
ncbi:uncharacterized protein BDR25DRAFT_275038 [Lindgomyces ingoldianus]|uniref:Uncharacterized protein n=1 Tax=Lindgomyces ingoldianus TaxID=673940 RepID=A0ACB6RGR2_9PLEO|nr:uncharacterized protein BDR25DRAFT_275038 [Lindgomyces ingoldianus]KAF2477702.1 hypothetical protein BDR25DRAFT_275038 [Lindgomyces ingoldianus]